MDCPTCGAECLAFGVPADLQPCVPGEESAAALCTHCLALHPAEGESDPEFEAISDGFPSNPEVAVPLALLIGLLDNLALYRSEISELLERVERGGTDPLLALDRLARDPEIDAEVDLAGRRRQLEQLL